ncbi:pilus assembly protein [Streptomyces sp. A7024]|uniref:Pilus assembly protein n=1 Tax=Streptomyces coryli TaxID=1128680 RepID=A0A6G4U6Q2_9ACTN|nr:TadE/TadG family type IV pilus assembly protein [Streptomyces coryli]NGN67068.1 pilus assembly protein [Streptomyces coryli]
MRRSERRRDRGQVAIEYLGFLPILLLVAIAGVQLGIVAYTASQAGTGARAAARVASTDGIEAGRIAGLDAMSGGLADDGKANFDIRYSGANAKEVTATAQVTIPSIIPGVDDFGTANKSVTMPRD